MDCKIKIDKGVSMPETRGARKYPFHLLEIGDSFFVPNLAISSISSSIVTAQAKIGSGAKFARRTVTENGVKGICVWRVS